ncbi:MAG: orotidine-5'-phosphate decarboxylase [Verrucomicrobiota bacterium]
MRNPIIVALDVPTVEQAIQLAHALKGSVGALKIGSELFTTAGPAIVKELKATGVGVFLDLKYHDIPNTVAKAVAAATRMGVDMLTIHTCGGSEMMKAAEEAAQKTALQAGVNAPLVLGVTVLTSMDQQALSETGVGEDVGKQVERLASLASQSGLRGLVCSPLEIALLRQILPAEMQLVTPGVRAAGQELGDQKRVLGPKEAMDAGANWLVIGRPIYQAANPRQAAEEILKLINS